MSAGPRYVLLFFLQGHMQPAVCLDFPSYATARAFRRGFQKSSATDFERFTCECPWMTRGSEFATPWMFFLSFWGLPSLARIELHEARIKKPR